MSYVPGEQVKRVQRMTETLDEKRAEVLRIQEDMNSLSLKHGKAKQALEQSRQQLAAELVKLDPGISEVVEALLEPAKKRAS